MNEKCGVFCGSEVDWHFLSTVASVFSLLSVFWDLEYKTEHGEIKTVTVWLVSCLLANYTECHERCHSGWSGWKGINNLTQRWDEINDWYDKVLGELIGFNLYYCFANGQHKT